MQRISPTDDLETTEIPDWDTPLDEIWIDLDGDLVPDMVIDTSGPFTTVSVELDDWSMYLEIGRTGFDGELPEEVFHPYNDSVEPAVFEIPETDWCVCEAYDPMAIPSDWTTDGYVDFGDPLSLPGYEIPFTDAGLYYDTADTGGYGYWDLDSYFDASSSVLDPGGFDPGGWDTGWDPTAGDAMHESFIDLINYDPSDPNEWTPGELSDHWMNEYQEAEQASWDNWNSSVDAYLGGDDLLAYEFNQQSLEWGAYGEDAWNYSNEAWDTGWDTDTSWDTGWDSGSSWDTGW